jgi:hypothetical protein
METRTAVKRKTGKGVAVSASRVERASTDVKRLERGAETRVKRAVGVASGFATKHPAVAAGALLGAGALVGVAAQRALHHEPTLGEVVLRVLKRGASRVSKQVATTASSGLRMGKARAKRALR